MDIVLALAASGLVGVIAAGIVRTRLGRRHRSTSDATLVDRLNAEVRRRDALASIGRLALEGTDPTGLADEAVHRVREVLDAAACSLVHPDDDRLLSVASTLADPTAATPTEQTTTALVAASGTAPVAVARPDGTISTGELEQVAGPIQAVAVRLGRSVRDGALVVAGRPGWTLGAPDVAFLGDVAESLHLAQERRGAEEEAHHRALHDSLTGLANQALFLDRLRHALTRHRLHRRPVGVVFIDIDRFKAVNDNHGHAAGDQVLIEAAGRLQRVIRPVDTVARFGGDEFTLLCEELRDVGQLEAVARRIRSAFGDPFEVRGTPVRLTASIGIASAGGADTPAVATAERLLQEADTAMYEAKARGRDCWVRYDETMREGRITRLVTQSELREALAYDQLTLRYQPVVDLRTEQVRAVEGLVRWQHPTRGLVSPNEFIPISEETGIIEDLGRWVLRQAAQQAARWQDAGYSLTTSVNLSARQLASPHLVDTLDEVLAQSGLDPTSLCLEISETDLMTDVARSMTVLGVLRERGVHVAVDDFGTGYSSLAYLTRLPVDTMKVDRVFVDTVATSAEDRAITAAVIALAHSLGMAAIAEGVETREQVRVLRDLGCDGAQGYLFARPAHPEELDLSSAKASAVGA